MLLIRVPRSLTSTLALAARTAYAIGLHRTEVNASFGSSIRKMRDCIWKSLRVVDMVISTVLGRPPSTSDVDCTVKYSIPESDQVQSNILDPSVQIFMIIERVVVEVYSRKRISIRIADYVSRQLKGWASRWLLDLTKLTVEHNGVSRSTVIGACSTLCSYYYGIMLLTRPFLIYEIYEHLGAPLRGGGTQSDHRQKRKYADAALDAAASFVETLRAVIDTEIMPRRMPLIVWVIFALTSTLLLTVSDLGCSRLRLSSPLVFLVDPALSSKTAALHRSAAWIISAEQTLTHGSTQSSSNLCLRRLLRTRKKEKWHSACSGNRPHPSCLVCYLLYLTQLPETPHALLVMASMRPARSYRRTQRKTPPQFQLLTTGPFTTQTSLRCRGLVRMIRGCRISSNPALTTLAVKLLPIYRYSPYMISKWVVPWGHSWAL